MDPLLVRERADAFRASNPGAGEWLRYMDEGLSTTDMRRWQTIVSTAEE